MVIYHIVPAVVGPALSVDGDMGERAVIGSVLLADGDFRKPAAAPNLHRQGRQNLRPA